MDPARIQRISAFGWCLVVDVSVPGKHTTAEAFWGGLAYGVKIAVPRVLSTACLASCGQKRSLPAPALAPNPRSTSQRRLEDQFSLYEGYPGRRRSARTTANATTLDILRCGPRPRRSHDKTTGGLRTFICSRPRTAFPHQSQLVETIAPWTRSTVYADQRRRL